MDDRTRNPDLVSEEGTVRISGGTTPDAYPHKCPYRPNGATREFCLETTLNFQRNQAGCCGTNDYRNIGPCNSKFRRCWRCLIEGRGTKAEIVADVGKGLCQQHLAVVGTPDPTFRPARSVLFVPTKSPPVRTRPAWAQQQPPAASSGNDVPKEQKKPVKEKPASVPQSRKSSASSVDLQRFITPQLLERVQVAVRELSKRGTETALALLDYDIAAAAKRLGITEPGAVTYCNALSNKLGIPPASELPRHTRTRLLKLVLGRYREVLQEVAAREAPTSGGKEIAATSEELELVALFRSMTEGNRTVLLAMAKELK